MIGPVGWTDDSGRHGASGPRTCPAGFTFIVWAADVFTILDLRSLYFCLDGLLRRLVHLHCRLRGRPGGTGP
ncbi:hypothetical protein AB0G15_32245 [Streptosporangium sp. NPDC023825]|uniref:hypothetical protein n=1 Tax=Streptosporangium sp. NPDC023825 TaxID=3154909 RepID=UPI00341AF260